MLQRGQDRGEVVVVAVAVVAGQVVVQVVVQVGRGWGPWTMLGGRSVRAVDRWKGKEKRGGAKPSDQAQDGGQVQS